MNYTAEVYIGKKPHSIISEDINRVERFLLSFNLSQATVDDAILSLKKQKAFPNVIYFLTSNITTISDCVKPEAEDLTHLEEFWSKCCFCGSHNGKYKRPLEEHRPRCRFVGPANDTSVVRPNYFKFIEEDDKRLLPMMHAKVELPPIKKKNTELFLIKKMCDDHISVQKEYYNSKSDPEKNLSLGSKAFYSEKDFISKLTESFEKENVETKIEK